MIKCIIFISPFINFFTPSVPNEIKNIVHATASKVLGKPKNKPKKPWISSETFALIDKKRVLRQQRRCSNVADACYKASKRAVQSKLRKDKNTWLDTMHKS